jgi:hypothetical protein
MAAEQTGFIIISLSGGRFDALLYKGEDLRELSRQAAAADLQRILEDYPDSRVERVVTSVPPERIRDLERQAEARGFRRERSLTSFWRLDARKPDKRRECFERLSKADAVENVYFEMAGSDPLVDSTDDVFAIQQRHLDPAPVGIDARWAWTQPHGSGAFVGFVDLEQGWNLSHEDLPAIAPMPGVPQDINLNPGSVRHGTGVMGISVGVDNKLGIIGAAPTPAWAGVASHFRAADGTSGHVADALTAVLASGMLSPGDVVLIEWQDDDNRPAEADPAVWTAIDLATALGMIVIEAAGNGNLDLDSVPGLNRSNPTTFKDSRAIIVGGSHSALDPTGVGHDRWMLTPPPPPPIPPLGSNWGSRLDCYAYGENVVTAGETPNPPGLLGGTGPDDSYRSDFAGTSAAAAIVAGAALVVQGMHKAAKGAPLDSLAMRTALSTFGTPQGPQTAAQNIGVMPDLKKIAGALDLVEDRPEPPRNLRILG